MANNEEQTFPIPEDVEEAPAMASASAQILETHGITTVVHEMKVNGYHLVERKQKTNVDPKASDNTPKMTISIHSRSIDDRFYDVQETLTEGMDEPDRVIETEMTQEEVETFEEDWSKLWNPQAKAHLDWKSLKSGSHQLLHRFFLSNDNAEIKYHMFIYYSNIFLFF